MVENEEQARQRDADNATPPCAIVTGAIVGCRGHRISPSLSRSAVAKVAQPAREREYIEDMGVQTWWLRRKRRATQKNYLRWAAVAKNYEEREALLHEGMWERDSIQDQISSVDTRELRDKAEILGIPIPSLSDRESWTSGQNPNTVYFSMAGAQKLRQAIRKEQREQRDQRLYWFTQLTPMISALTGLLGVVIAILALLHSIGRL